jgi:hypothetical protein
MARSAVTRMALRFRAVASPLLGGRSAIPRLVETVADFDKLEELESFPTADVFCALGTTIAKAGSQA